MEIIEKSADVNGNADKFTVYFNSDGKYVDADYNIGKLKIKLSSGKTADIKNTSEKDENTRASISGKATIGQDSNNIYRLADITIKLDAVDGAISSIDGIKIDNSTTGLLLGDKGKTLTFEVIQSLSKDSDSQRVSGIRCPKTVTNYFIGNSTGSKINLIKYAADGFTICNGKLINYNILIIEKVIKIKQKKIILKRIIQAGRAKMENGISIKTIIYVQDGTR